jgi:hypothetical protein
MRDKRFLCVRSFLVLGVLLLTSTLSLAFDAAGPFRVKRVVDGDTIVLAAGRRIRYLGINTPEYDEPFWKEAKDYNAGKVRGKSVMPEFGKVREDKYGRTLPSSLRQDGRTCLSSNRSATTMLFRRPRRRGGPKAWGCGDREDSGPLKITSLHADAPGDDRFNLNGEYIRLCNISQHAVDLQGFSLGDNEGYEYFFRKGVLRPGYTLLLLTGTGRDVPTGDRLFFY